MIYASNNNEYYQLFQNIPGSFNTLAIILAVKIQIIQAKPWVYVKYQSFLGNNAHFIHKLQSNLMQYSENNNNNNEIHFFDCLKVLFSFYVCVCVCVCVCVFILCVRTQYTTKQKTD